MQAFAFVLTLLIPDPNNLAAGDWRTRETWHAKYDNPVSAALLPATHEHPEIQFRCRQIRDKQLKWFDPAYVERHVHASDYERWLYCYVVHGDSQILTLEETFLELHSDLDKASLYFKLAPFDLERDDTLGGYGIPVWLRHVVVPGEYEGFLEHREIYRHPGR